MKQPEYISFENENRSMDMASKVFDQRIRDSQTIYEMFKDSFYERSCPICGKNDFKNVEKFHEKYSIAKCNVCCSLYVNPCPNYESLDYYYNKCECNYLLGKLYRNRSSKLNLIISDRTQKVVQIIEKQLGFKDKISVLEVGCSSGVFLSELKVALHNKGIFERCTLSGIDIDNEAIKRNVDKEISLQCISAENLSLDNQNRFDIVLHFELIEHLNNPYDFMLSIFNLLTNNGIVHFHTPNGKGFDNIALGYNSYRPLAHGIFPPMHLQSFNVENITHFSLRSGFNVSEIETHGSFDVDIISSCADEVLDEFKLIKSFSKNQLAILQMWLKKLNSSAAMRCTLSKKI